MDAQRPLKSKVRVRYLGDCTLFESVANNGHLPLLLKSDDTNTHSGHTHTPRTRTRVHTQTHTHKHTHMIKHTQETQRPIQSKYSHTVCNQSGRMMPLAWLGGLGASALVVSACVGRSGGGVARPLCSTPCLPCLSCGVCLVCFFFFCLARNECAALRCCVPRGFVVASTPPRRHLLRCGCVSYRRVLQASTGAPRCQLGRA